MDSATGVSSSFPIKLPSGKQLSRTGSKRGTNNIAKAVQKPSKRPLKDESRRDNKRPKLLPVLRRSDEPPSRTPGWINKERVLVVCSRGVSFLGRHLMRDLMLMMPHSKPDTKLDARKDLQLLNEMAEMKNAKKILFFEARKKKDLYVWLSCAPNGPSVKFLAENMSTQSELKLIGNALRGSRPVLCFDSSFSDGDSSKQPHLLLIRELLVQIFGTPNNHPKSQPFIDKVFLFTLLAGRIWFRCYQIANENGTLVEIGPRFSLNPIKIFTSSFSGAVIYENPNYISPNMVRHMMLKNKTGRYVARVISKSETKSRKTKRLTSYAYDSTDDIFE